MTKLFQGDKTYWTVLNCRGQQEQSDESFLLFLGQNHSSSWRRDSAASALPGASQGTKDRSLVSPGQELSPSLKQLHCLCWVMFFSTNKLTCPAKLMSLEAQLCMDTSKRLSSSSCLRSFLPRRLRFQGALAGILLREG